MVDRPPQGTADDILTHYRTLVQEDIERLLDARPDRALYRIVRYHLGLADAEGRRGRAGGGKAVRGTLCVLCCEAAGGRLEVALPAASAVELLHAFTLLHDDIADRDELRRGRPAAWRLWGAGRAMTAGDAVFALANLALARLGELGVPAERTAAALNELNRAALAVCEGQDLDLSYEGRDDVTVADYLDMVSLKTASLFAAAARTGALAAGAPPATVQALDDYGRRLGTAYQIRDDLLGIWGEAAELGKPVGSDLRRNKRSLPVVLALTQASPEASRRVAERLRAADLSDEDTASLAAELEAIGARARCEQLAQEAAHQALSRLEETALSPGPAANLRALAVDLLKRRS